LIGRADAALDEAKRGGRNCAAIAPDFLLEAAERRAVFEVAAAVSSSDPQFIIETEGRGPYRAKIVTRKLLCVCYTHIRTELSTLPGHLPSLVAELMPAVEPVANAPGDLLVNATKENVLRNTERQRLRSLVQPSAKSAYWLSAGSTAWRPDTSKSSGELQPPVPGQQGNRF